MTNVRSAASENRRRAILAAALDCFVRDGIAAATMEDIRAASGASIGSIYHHFESKELLAAALYLDGIGEYQAGLLRQMTRHAKARDGIRALVAYHLEWIKSHPNWARFLLAAREADFMSPNEHALREMNRRLIDSITAWIGPLAGRGEVVPLSPDTLLPLLLGPAQAFGRVWLAGRAITTIERAEEIFADAAWNAVRRRDGGEA